MAWLMFPNSLCSFFSLLWEQSARIRSSVEKKTYNNLEVVRSNFIYCWKSANAKEQDERVSLQKKPVVNSSTFSAQLGSASLHHGNKDSTLTNPTPFTLIRRSFLYAFPLLYNKYNIQLCVLPIQGERVNKKEAQIPIHMS